MVVVENGYGYGILKMYLIGFDFKFNLMSLLSSVCQVVILVSENLVWVANFPINNKLTFATQALNVQLVRAVVCLDGSE